MLGFFSDITSYSNPLKMSSNTCDPSTAPLFDQDRPGRIFILVVPLLVIVDEELSGINPSRIEPCAICTISRQGLKNSFTNGLVCGLRSTVSTGVGEMIGVNSSRVSGRGSW